MSQEQNPYKSPADTQKHIATSIVSPLVCGIMGAFLGTIAFSQSLSTLGFAVDIAANSGMLFRLIGSAAGVVVGLPVGAATGWLVGKGKRVRFRVVAFCAILFCLAFSSTLLFVAGGSSVVMVLLPIFGLVSGGLIGVTVSVLWLTSKIKT